MSAEFHNSSEDEQQKLTIVPVAKLYEMALDVTDISLLDQILFVASELYIQDNTNTDAGDLMQYILQKKHDLGRHFEGTLSEEELRDIDEIAREGRQQTLALRAVEQSFFDSEDLEIENAIKHLIDTVIIDPYEPPTKPLDI